jgi:predicted HNH restriction endonuclease
LGKVASGDLVWVVTYAENKLWLMARIVVQEVTSQERAARKLGEKPGDLWTARWHVLAVPETAQRVKRVDITPIATKLRFKGLNPKLPADFSHHHLRTMRALTEEASSLLERAWKTPAPSAHDLPNDDEELAAFEGEQRPLMIRHRKREQKLRKAKVALILNQQGTLRCEVPGCGFDFHEVYGETGKGYAHVHHLKPLSGRAQPEATALRDLIVVCANCHAMIHRGGACRAPASLIPRRPMTARTASR